MKSQTFSKPILEAKVKKQVTLTEKQHVINLLKLLIKENISMDNISFKRNKLNNVIGTYIKKNHVKNATKIIGGVLKYLEKQK